VLLLVATLVRGRPVLPDAEQSDIYLTALGALVTIVYMAGLIFRRQRRIARLGPDSHVVLASYVIGIASLVVLQ
jgi:cation:H+ antiporter